MNAGVMLICRAQRFLDARVELDHGRLRALAPYLDDAAVETIAAERRAVEGEVTRLAAARAADAAAIAAPLLAKYDQLRKLRRGIAVAQMVGELCEACHVRLRPTVTLQVRRNAEIVQCDSCQRILYFVAPADASASAT